MNQDNFENARIKDRLFRQRQTRVANRIYMVAGFFFLVFFVTLVLPDILERLDRSMPTWLSVVGILCAIAMFLLVPIGKVFEFEGDIEVDFDAKIKPEPSLEKPPTAPLEINMAVSGELIDGHLSIDGRLIMVDSPEWFMLLKGCEIDRLHVLNFELGHDFYLDRIKDSQRWSAYMVDLEGKRGRSLDAGLSEDIYSKKLVKVGFDLDRLAGTAF